MFNNFGTKLISDMRGKYLIKPLTKSKFNFWIVARKADNVSESLPTQKILFPILIIQTNFKISCMGTVIKKKKTELFESVIQTFLEKVEKKNIFKMFV